MVKKKFVPTASWWSDLFGCSAIEHFLNIRWQHFAENWNSINMIKMWLLNWTKWVYCNEVDECISEGAGWSPLHRLCHVSVQMWLSPSCSNANLGIADADCTTNDVLFDEKSPAWTSRPPGPFLSAVFSCRDSCLERRTCEQSVKVVQADCAAAALPLE